jgi:hypothetical protein
MVPKLEGYCWLFSDFNIDDLVAVGSATASGAVTVTVVGEAASCTGTLSATIFQSSAFPIFQT